MEEMRSRVRDQRALAHAKRGQIRQLIGDNYRTLVVSADKVVEMDRVLEDLQRRLEASAKANDALRAYMESKETSVFIAEPMLMTPVQQLAFLIAVAEQSFSSRRFVAASEHVLKFRQIVQSYEMNDAVAEAVTFMDLFAQKFELECLRNIQLTERHVGFYAESIESILILKYSETRDTTYFQDVARKGLQSFLECRLRKLKSFCTTLNRFQSSAKRSYYCKVFVERVCTYISSTVELATCIFFSPNLFNKTELFDPSKVSLTISLVEIQSTLRNWLKSFLSNGFYEAQTTIFQTSQDLADLIETGKRILSLLNNLSNEFKNAISGSKAFNLHVSLWSICFHSKFSDFVLDFIPSGLNNLSSEFAEKLRGISIVSFDGFENLLKHVEDSIRAFSSIPACQNEFSSDDELKQLFEKTVPNSIQKALHVAVSSCLEECLRLASEFSTREKTWLLVKDIFTISSISTHVLKIAGDYGTQSNHELHEMLSRVTDIAVESFCIVVSASLLPKLQASLLSATEFEIEDVVITTCWNRKLYFVSL